MRQDDRNWLALDFSNSFFWIFKFYIVWFGRSSEPGNSRKSRVDLGHWSKNPSCRGQFRVNWPSPTHGVRGHEKTVWPPTPGSSSLQSTYPTGQEVWEVSVVWVWSIGPNKPHPSLPPTTSLPGERGMVQMTSLGPRTQWIVKIWVWGGDSS